MRKIYHIVPKAVGDRIGSEPYRADSLAMEGFIHCSNRDQVARVANLFYADQAELLVLCLDGDRLGSLLRDEDSGTGELFPHVYGPIEQKAILEVRCFERDANGNWVFPDDSDLSKA
jgi:uncharacterized protein (DUF952 family)